VTLHVHNCYGRNRIISLLRRSNTDSTAVAGVDVQRDVARPHLLGS
jgi:hypothetical protein